MSTAAEFTGILLTSETPERTVEFYKTVAGLEFREMKQAGVKFWETKTNGLQISIHDVKTHAKGARSSGRESNLSLYFSASDLPSLIKRLQISQVKYSMETEEIIAVEDTDGRDVTFGKM